MIKKKSIPTRILFVFLILAFLFPFAPPRFPLFFARAEKEVFIVRSGAAEEALIRELYRKGFIREPVAFKLVLKIQGWEGRIEPGGYLISKNMSALELAKTLVTSLSQKWVRIPEGARKEEVADVLQTELSWQSAQREDFLRRAGEGYLMPDTYLFSLDWPGTRVAERLENQFLRKFKEISGSDSEPDPEIVILASLLQREAASAAEMPLIAGIILNRYRDNLPLQIDAALQYAVGAPSNWWPIVRPEHKDVQSPYNTYLYRGYPPAPICSPGAQAIAAAINPQETDYLYYLHDRNRQIHLAKTYQEHLINIQKYLR